MIIMILINIHSSQAKREPNGRNSPKLSGKVQLKLVSVFMESMLLHNTAVKVTTHLHQLHSE